ncbi:MAG: hypothetical protein WAZ77_09420 [Candidatus Nitrosopolaris sp.]|jgi:hypothetical protein
MRTGIFVGIYPTKLATIIRMSYGNLGETRFSTSSYNSIKTIFLPVVTA